VIEALCHKPEGRGFQTVLLNSERLTQSASELYRPSDRRLSAKLVQTFADRGV
jgi:hypothetical protein